ncbi:PucR C-terminal helix-turn-helix domain-containing protein [Amycolatopsis arida]|uniref:PucR C-terminal helix-turn-helix domain-containing protein n=1 Tax=Amycolatopsis arida TaxID=587909 RepID=A0A1I5KX19_9PSEU|nr:helix-turn-helix domain-containing protein [Amycolatopsis arida]TDX85865.1 PucR-like helix-turn-helix protein [Amycolatopsis arida]SFO89428.1 PucR C-terminal helix-turn-helix domain-containing protein [Amycolatopsis arida]
MTELSQRMARVLITRLDALTDALVDDILTENPGYHDAALVSLAELSRSCRSNLERVLQLLGDTVPTGANPFDAAMATGARRAEQRVPLDSVLRSFRLGGRVIWRAMVRLAKEDDSVDRDQLLDLATSLWTVVDETSSELSRAYRHAEVQLRQLDTHRRHALVEDLLRGRGREAGFIDQAATELGLPAASDYVVLVADLAADGTPGLAMPQDALAVYGVRSVWEPRAQTMVGLVALEGHPVTHVLDLLRGGVRARVGVSPAVHGLAEVAAGHDLALLALRTLPTDGIGLAQLDERLPEALVARSPELAERLLHAVLGPLLRLPPGERQVLLDTLRAWLETNRSAAGTAARLYCHRNTVLNRLRRLTTLLGRDLQDHGSGLSLALALIAHDLRGAGTPAQGRTRHSGHSA